MTYKKKKWNLLQETKKIGEFICFKAESVNINKSKQSNPIIVWYAPSLPYRFGPGKYHGFPGLVVSVENKGLIYKLSKLSLSIKEKRKIKKPTNGIRITEEELNKEYNKLFTK